MINKTFYILDLYSKYFIHDITHFAVHSIVVCKYERKHSLARDGDPNK